MGGSAVAMHAAFPATPPRLQIRGRMARHAPARRVQTRADRPLLRMDPGGDYFWSGSPGEYVGTHWMMSFNGSSPSAGSDRSTASVRCVRDLPR